MAPPKIDIKSTAAVAPAPNEPQAADLTVDHIFEILPKHIRQHDGSIDQDELASDVMRFARNHGQTTNDFFKTVKKTPP
jgi:hypothetical protein